MRKPLALVAALLVVASALALAAPAAAGKIYWTNAKNGAVGRANLDGTHVDRRFIRGAETLFDVAVDAAHVYWTTRRRIGRSNLNGGALDLGFISGGGPLVGGRGRRCARLLGEQRDRTSEPRRHWRRPDLHHQRGRPRRGGRLRTPYWAHRWIGRANLDGTGVEQRFITRAGYPCGLAVDARHVYWSDEATRSDARTSTARTWTSASSRAWVTPAGLRSPPGTSTGPSNGEP